MDDYDETVNANVLNGHSTAAIRYFHSLIAGNLKWARIRLSLVRISADSSSQIDMLDSLVMENRQVSPFYSLRLSDHFNRPGIIEKGNNLDDLARGLATQPQRDSDMYFDEEVIIYSPQREGNDDNVYLQITQYLFRRGRTLGSDLRATDIQRDRDHGLASYNDYREYCGLPRAKSFADFADYIQFEVHWTVYRTPLCYANCQFNP